MKVFESRFVTPLHVADEIKPIMPHWLISGLIRLLGGTPSPVCYVRGEQIKEQVAYVMRDKIFMSPLMFNAIRKDCGILNNNWMA